MSRPAEQVHRWTRAEYERIVDAGGFHPGARLELLDGEIVDMSPQKSRHATAVSLVEQALRACLGAESYLRIQMPLALDAWSEPEPDVAVISGGPRDYADGHPGTAALVVEVADTSLAFDIGRKSVAYARNKIPEYWVLNLPDCLLEVYRSPEGESYTHRSSLSPEDAVAPLVAPGCRIRVGDLLP